MQPWGSANTPSVIIDLSPIVRLGGKTSWQRLEDVVAAWRQQRDPQARFYGVADNSLSNLLDEDGQRSLREWKRNEMARSVPWADPVILELAGKFHIPSILTTDLYRDLRGTFGWLQGTDRVWKPVIVGGAIEFEQLDYSAITADEISRHAEEAGLKPKGVRTRGDRALLRYEWQCTNDGCRWAARTVIEDDPAIRNGHAVCPSCRNPATKLQLREQTKEIVVLFHGNEVDRIPLAEDTELTIGRGAGTRHYNVREILDDAASERISRAHLKLTNKAGRILVEDLGSTNGTQIVESDGVEKSLQTRIPQSLTSQMRITLARGTLSIRVSGKQRPHGRYNPNQNARQGESEQETLPR